MQIRYHKRFEKHYQKLSDELKNKVQQKIAVFSQNPLDRQLKNHALTGKLFGKRAFSVTGDMRVIFEEFEDYTLVLFVDVGTHNQVY